MAKDEQWVENHKNKQQDEWQKKKAQEFQEEVHKAELETARKEGRVCPKCGDIGDFQYRDEKEEKVYNSSFGVHDQHRTVVTWHLKECKCRKCGHVWEIKRWKDKSTWDKIVDWFKDLF